MPSSGRCVFSTRSQIAEGANRASSEARTSAESMSRLAGVSSDARVRQFLADVEAA
jgi:hypothetical protein